MPLIEQKIHRRIADALAYAEGCPVHACRARVDGRNGVHDREVAVAIAVPVDAASDPQSRATLAMNFTTAAAPVGVAWPTVSDTHSRDAPARIAVAYACAACRDRRGWCLR